jgi:hypothetical protein
MTVLCFYVRQEFNEDIFEESHCFLGTKTSLNVSIIKNHFRINISSLFFIKNLKLKISPQVRDSLFFFNLLPSRQRNLNVHPIKRVFD